MINDGSCLFIYFIFFLLTPPPSSSGIINDNAISRHLGCSYFLRYTKRRELVRVIRVRLGRFTLEQCHFQTFALGPPILEPKLHVLRLQSGKLLPIRHPVQFLRVFQYQLRIRIEYCKIVSTDEGKENDKIIFFIRLRT